MKNAAPLILALAALAALVLGTSLVLSACPQPAGPDTSEPLPPAAPPETPPENISYTFKVQHDASSIDITFSSIDDGTGKRSITIGASALDWSTTDQKDPSVWLAGFSVVKPDSNVNLAALVAQTDMPTSITLDFASSVDNTLLSDRDKGAIEASIKGLLGNIANVTITRGAKIIAGEYPVTTTPTSIGMKIAPVGAVPEKAITVTVPASGNLSAPMEWFKAYQGNSGDHLPLSSSFTLEQAYDLVTLKDAGRSLDLAFSTSETGNGKEITENDRDALFGKFAALLGGMPVASSNIGSVLTIKTDNTYTEEPTPPPGPEVENIQSFNLGVFPATGTVNASTVALTISRNDSSANTTAFSVPSLTADSGTVSLSGKDITVTINKAASTADISLAYVHYLRQALVAAGASSVTIDAGAGAAALTPSFKGSDWLSWQNVSPDSLYVAYNNGDVIMSGIEMTTGSDGKKIIEYTRPIMIDDAEYYIDPAIDFSGLGIKQGSGGSISPISGKTWDQVVIDSPPGITGKGYVSDWSNYLTDLREAGLSRVQNPDGSARADLSTAPYPTHNIGVNWGSASNNIVQNGAYDFILAHYNLKAAGGVDGDDRSSSIDGISWSGGTFDGKNAPPSGFPARKVNLVGSVVTLGSLDRKNSAGNINNVFYGSLNTAMARYLQTKLSVAEFKNANIYGDANQWNSQNITDSPRRSNLTNVALVGSYNGTSISTTVKGVLDIVGNGSPSQSILNTSKGGYLNFIGNVGTTNIRYSNFSILDVTQVNNNIAKIGAANNSNSDIPDAKIYTSKNQATNVPNGSYGTPTYRAFENSGGTRKYAPSSFATNYKSPTNPSGNVPNLSISAWETAAPNAPATINASGNVWSNINDLEN